jgi:hypothetical protein
VQLEQGGLTFDWYQPTIPAGVDDVLEVLWGLADGLALSHQRGMHGYAHTAVLGNEARGPVARVWHGGSHPYPHAVLSGDYAQPGAELIRTAFPAHTVARADVKADFEGPEVYDQVLGQLLGVAARRGVKVGTAGDHLVTMRGRTTYLGSTKSPVRVRLYDKAAELRAQLVPPKWANAEDWYREKGVPEHLTRLEAQIRPHTREAKASFATLEPQQMLGSAAWLREVWREVAQLDVQPVRVSKAWRQSDDERAYRYMLAHYGGVLRRLHVDLGSWECVGLQIGEDLRGD